MPTPYRALHTHTLPAGTSYYKYEQGLPRRVTPDSPATEVMTDLRRVKAITIAPQANIETALRKMVVTEVRLLLVISNEDTVIGLITARDILGEKPVHYGARLRIPREEILVEHIMVPLDKIQVLHIDEVMYSRVGDIILTLKEAGRQHALVLDKHPACADNVVRGIFSTTQIGKQLGVDIPPTGKVQSFAELEAALTENYHLKQLAS